MLENEVAFCTLPDHTDIDSTTKGNDAANRDMLHMWRDQMVRKVSPVESLAQPEPESINIWPLIRGALQLHLASESRSDFGLLGLLHDAVSGFYLRAAAEPRLTTRTICIPRVWPNFNRKPHLITAD